MGGKHKKCQGDNCSLIASFGFNKTLGTKYCSKHKEEGMINLLCKLCSCGKARPTYNYSGLSANFCKDCKTEDMINVNDKNCKCGLARPTFNFKGLKPEFCSKCKTDEMINVKDTPCKCGKSSRPNFNYQGLKPEYCSKCKYDGMIDVVHTRCFCGKVQPSFNFVGLQPKYCVNCKLDGMISLKTHLCIKCNFRQSDYNFPGNKPKYCANCKENGMINISNKCKNDMCCSSGNVKYNYFCSHCFVNLFPTDSLSLQVKIKSKENYVRDFLREKFEGFVHDTILWTGNCDCSHRRRIDFRKLIGNTLLCIEVDENQHKRYDNKDEEIRYDDLFMAHGGKFIFIRFNPDKYINKNGTKVNPYMKKRMETLHNEIVKQINRILQEDNKELLEIIYLFYDNFN
jgi:hypothetical protein